MILRNHHLREKVRQRLLLSIHREGVSQHSVQGFLLDFSSNLLLVQQIIDFHLEGYLLLRRKDITALTCGPTSRFQRELLNTEGLLDQINFDFRAPIESYEAFLISRGPEEIVIVEDERTDTREFLMGTIANVKNGEVNVHHLNGSARRAKHSLPLPLERITCCQIATNYIQFYERHLQRMACKP